MLEQVEACPNCGQLAGWWSPLKRSSMVFHKPNGEKTEERLFEARRCNCAGCDHDITKCVQDDSKEAGRSWVSPAKAFRNIIRT